ncbi:MAG: oligosaccharide flippase family protein, partial [Methyloprofundus sp.]|nr:oligosaccharide flippase family protein [Methyloprofundus sp.]
TLGYFQRAKSLNLLVVQYSSGSLMSVLFPVLAQVKNDLPRFRKIAIKMMGIISFIVFLLLGGLYLLSEELIILLFGEKWLPSVHFFQILVFSGFAYPVSALLVNILSSRGNSKGFLRLEVFKKSLVSINLLVLYFFGINSYLYGLMVTSVFGLSLNIFFATREIKSTFFSFLEPIVDQAIIVILSVVSAVYLISFMDMPSEILFFVEGFLFTILYLIFSWIFKTKSYYSFLDQIISKHKITLLENTKAL